MALHSFADMEAAVTLVTTRLETISPPPRNWGVYNSQVSALGEDIRRELGAVIRDGAGGEVRVRICGIEASSTLGLAAALRHWSAAARKRLALQWGGVAL